MPFSITNESDPAVRQLRSALDAFYADPGEYMAFASPSDHRDCWEFVLQQILQTLADKDKCRVLEIGAGRSGFPDFCKHRNVAVHYTAQDVTSANQPYLQCRADGVFIGDLNGLNGEFDVIFSTFVLEHITAPRSLLDKAWSLLAPGGSLFIFCPRYDFPLYVPPSVRHHGWPKRLAIAALIAGHRLRVLSGGRPAFLITTDPAVFHGTWTPDTDAVHIVSQFDLHAFFRDRGTRRRLPRKAASLLDWFGKNWLQVNLCVRKPEREEAK